MKTLLNFLIYNVYFLLTIYRYCKKKFRQAGLIDKYRKYMRLSAAEKYEIIQTVTRSEIGVKRTLESFGIARSSFYK